MEILDWSIDEVGGHSAKNKGGLIMATKRTLNAKEIVNDIRSRMTDVQLMAKYALSERGLESVLRKLLEAKLITSSEFNWRPLEYDDTVSLDFESLDRKK